MWFVISSRNWDTPFCSPTRVTLWAKRQVQIERVTTSMVTVVGELQAIAHDKLPQLDAIESLAGSDMAESAEAAGGRE